MRDRVYQVLERLVIFLALLWVIFATTPDPSGDTINSRLATVYSLSVHGTWTIGGPDFAKLNPFEAGTVDKVRVGERTLSSKPPVLPLLMYAEYQILRPIIRWDIQDEEDHTLIARTMTYTFAGGGYLLCIVFTWKLLMVLVLSPGVRSFIMIALAFGTQLTGYATQFNNHVPATGLAMCALFYAVGITQGDLSPKPWRIILFGFTGALAAVIDIPVAIFMVLAGVNLLFHDYRQTLIWIFPGILPVLFLHTGILWWTTGSLLPIQMHREFYLYENAYWRIPQGIDALNEPKLLYLFHMTFGRSGIFLLFPILLIGPMAFFRALWPKPFSGRALILGGGVGVIGLTVYYVLGTNNYGGEAFGLRWLIVAMPVLLVMGALAMEQLHRPALAYVLLPLLLISGYSAYESWQHPWESDAAWTGRLWGPAVVLPQFDQPDAN